MAAIRFDVRVITPREQAAQQAVDAAVQLANGNRAEAERLYAEAAAMPVAHRSGWINLAALAVGLGDWQAARAHAMRALQMDRTDVDAWVNLGVASWNLDLRRDAAQAMHRALELSPGLEPAALNYNLMHQAVGQLASARKVLADALARNPGSVRMQQAMAEVCRLLGDAAATRNHVLRAIALLSTKLPPAVAIDDASKARAHDSGPVQQALFAAHEALGAAGLPFHLIGGTLLAIHRDGQPFPHDKDVDLALPFDTDRDAVQAAFANGFRPVLRADDPNALASRQWVMGFVHEASGIGVDLMFVREQDGLARFELGWPDRLACEMPVYPLQAIEWAGRQWQVPAPPSHYLEALYGTDWNGDANSRGFDRKWFDTQVSNPSRTADSLPRAVTLGLLRLLNALQAGQRDRARALCLQILAREPLAEVEAILAQLGDATAA